MKKALLFLVLAGSLSANAQQKLKDLLYSGKIKKDTTGVIRQSDDLSTKIDTAPPKPVVAEVPKPVTSPANPVAVPATTADVAADAVTAEVTTEAAPASKAAPAKPNSRVWKEYSDSLVKVLNAEVMTNKRVKKEDYFVTADLEINPDGTVAVVAVTSTPENEFLQGQVRDRIESAPPRLVPTVDSTGKGKKTKKRYTFNVLKD